ncbi:uncharacterized protein EV420DRAFT_1274421 [Desarmillaria tabescens]|uniref:MYND-type domain-containing protein n=1 Tax=Armillaria tabescens TaxID=1929756 RepID=A0AA39MYC6_ARMTA|nr:uncharacterized protein EV420DRAFT_1274421 [Desarmillaria tabescens]KAK0451217.1 hypothetical protein EV420DRAFT_1274421 [Desarmillaria tabescens]
MMNRIPPLTANYCQACYSCFKTEGPNTKISRCTRCKRVSYCGTDCQKKDWRQHKAICKALDAVEKSALAISTLTFSLADAPSTDIDYLNMLGDQIVKNEISQIMLPFSKEGRPLNTAEQNLLAFQPRCMACARTDRLLRMKPSPLRSSSLSSCPDCKMAFYCSNEHWEAIRYIHQEQAREEGPTQCQINQEVRADILFADIMSGMNVPFSWAPERVKDAWHTLEGATWESEYQEDVRQAFGTDLPASVVVRATSNHLSMPMTILWALEHLNEGDAWTTKETLTIHIIGAYEAEVFAGQAFEEILHRLPRVKTLKLILCGPQLPNLMKPWSSEVMVMDTCSDCKSKTRARIHEHRRELYHELGVQSTFGNPDLAVAFNSGLSEENAGTWPDTIKFLVKRKIPSIFTAFNRQEAEADAKILIRCGAQLVSSLGPRKNLWGSLLAKPEPCKVYGFYFVNGWVAGAFH